MTLPRRPTKAMLARGEPDDGEGIQGAMSKLAENKCPVCGGRKAPGTTTFTAELGFGVVVVRKVKALVCDQCGEKWIQPDAARKLEEIVGRARKDRRQVEILEMPA